MDQPPHQAARVGLQGGFLLGLVGHDDLECRLWARGGHPGAPKEASPSLGTLRGKPLSAAAHTGSLLGLSPFRGVDLNPFRPLNYYPIPVLGILFLVGVNALRLWLRYVCTVAYRNLRRRFVR
jgi:hypothetical protein